MTTFAPRLAALLDMAETAGEDVSAFRQELAKLCLLAGSAMAARHAWLGVEDLGSHFVQAATM